MQEPTTILEIPQQTAYRGQNRRIGFSLFREKGFPAFQIIVGI
jgi:hypothetical protein